MKLVNHVAQLGVNKLEWLSVKCSKYTVGVGEAGGRGSVVLSGERGALTSVVAHAHLCLRCDVIATPCPRANLLVINNK